MAYFDDQCPCVDVALLQGLARLDRDYKKTFDPKRVDEDIATSLEITVKLIDDTDECLLEDALMTKFPAMSTGGHLLRGIVKVLTEGGGVAELAKDYRENFRRWAKHIRDKQREAKVMEWDDGAAVVADSAGAGGK